MLLRRWELPFLSGRGTVNELSDGAGATVGGNKKDAVFLDDARAAEIIGDGDDGNAAAPGMSASKFLELLDVGGRGFAAEVDDDQIGISSAVSSSAAPCRGVAEGALRHQRSME